MISDEALTKMEIAPDAAKKGGRRPIPPGRVRGRRSSCFIHVDFFFAAPRCVSASQCTVPIPPPNLLTPASLWSYSTIGPDSSSSGHALMWWGRGPRCSLRTAALPVAVGASHGRDSLGKALLPDPPHTSHHSPRLSRSLWEWWIWWGIWEQRDLNNASLGIFRVGPWKQH